MESLEIIETGNSDFYSNSRAYLDALQRQGLTDDGFEDEFYFTMPAISGSA
ncbi:MAG: hypothetical protein ACE5RN_03875 [Nitrosopumilaceae archaeon]